MDDVWHPAPGFEGVYEITRCGKVRSTPRYVNSPAVSGGSRLIKGKQMSLMLIRGYPGFVGRKMDGRKSSICVHRLLALAFIPNPERKPEVNHIDGNKTNFHLSNLEWTTHAENMRHAFRTGLVPFPTSGPGDLSPAAKLDWERVRSIRQALRDGRTHADIGKEFGVKKGAIGCIARNETWRVAP